MTIDKKVDLTFLDRCRATWFFVKPAQYILVAGVPTLMAMNCANTKEAIGYSVISAIAGFYAGKKMEKHESEFKVSS